MPYNKLFDKVRKALKKAKEGIVDSKTVAKPESNLSLLGAIGQSKRRSKRMEKETERLFKD